MSNEKKKLPEEKDLHIERPKFMTSDSGRPWATTRIR